MKGIEIKSLTKLYGKKCALNNVSITFEENKIYGLLGRNGAGKSTLMNIIANRIFATSGEVLIDGENACENENAQSKLYLMSEAMLYPEGARVKEVFKATKQFYPLFDIEYAVNASKMFELNTACRVKALSTGFASILKLIIALSVNVPYVLLDEPVLGLDANNRDLFYKLMLEKYAKAPFTLILSTHLIEEVSAVIEDVIIIKSGELLLRQSREELVQKCYSASGAAAAVDEFVIDKRVLGQDVLGGLKSAYILGERPFDTGGIEIGTIELQKLFILMTNSKEAL